MTTDVVGEGFHELNRIGSSGLALCAILFSHAAQIALLDEGLHCSCLIELRKKVLDVLLFTFCQLRVLTMGVALLLHAECCCVLLTKLVAHSSVYHFRKKVSRFCNLLYMECMRLLCWQYGSLRRTMKIQRAQAFTLNRFIASVRSKERARVGNVICLDSKSPTRSF